MKLFASAIIVTLTLSSSAFALKILPETATSAEISTALTNTYDFEGIVKLDNCSGSIIRFSGQPGNANAYVLTNGHCIKHSSSSGYLAPGEVVFKKQQARSMKVFDRYMKLFSVTTKELVYATMTNTDAAIYELEETYDDIEALGIRSFDFDSVRPMVGSDIDIVSGYWDRGYRCHIDGFVHLLLEGHWTFTDAIRYSDKGCETIGGTSGSPIIQTGTRVVIGINNTGNKDGGRCQLNNPCEQDEDGTIDVLKRSYGQQTYNFYSCLTPDFKIDLSIEGCSLPK